MTTIAYRDGVLAADTLRTSNGMRDGYQRKIHKCGRLLIAGAGSAAVCEQFRSWVLRGMVGPSPFEGKPDSGNGLVITPDGLAVIWGSSGPWQLKDVPFLALGTGEQIAMGAMAMGGSAEEAVRAAITLNISSGGEIQTVRV